jgi:hypothetical protein
MYCIIVYFNEGRTDYLVFGPYKSHDAAHEAYMRHFINRWRNIHTFEIAQVLGE